VITGRTRDAEDPQRAAVSPPGIAKPRLRAPLPAADTIKVDRPGGPVPTITACSPLISFARSRAQETAQDRHRRYVEGTLADAARKVQGRLTLVRPELEKGRHGLRSAFFHGRLHAMMSGTVCVDQARQSRSRQKQLRFQAGG